MVPMLISTLHAETGYLACMTELRHASVIAQGASWNGTVVEPLIKDIPNKAEYNNLYIPPFKGHCSWSQMHAYIQYIRNL